MKTASFLNRTQHQRFQFRSVRYRIKSTKENSDVTPFNDISTRPPETREAPRGATVFDKIRVRRSPALTDDSVMYKTANEWVRPKSIINDQVPSPGYLDTFKSMMGTKRLGKAENEEWKMKSRINLPTLDDCDQSKFTILDPIPIPIAYISDSVEQQSTRLKNNIEEARQCSNDLKRISTKFTEELQSLVNNTNAKLMQLRGALKNNCVTQQEFKLDIKRQINELNELNSGCKSTFDTTLNKTQDMQQLIFNTLPYELVENPDFQLEFQEKLF